MTKPSGTINLWEIPRLLIDAGHDSDNAHDTVRKALLNRDLYAHTYRLDGKYDPTGKRIDFDHTDWTGPQVWVALFAGEIPWPLNEDPSDKVSVLVNVRDAKKWIKSVTGGAVKREAKVKDETACKKWLIIEMKRGDKPISKCYYAVLAVEQFNLGHNPFQRAWVDAIENVGNRTWNAPGPIKNGPDPQNEIPMIKERLREFVTPNS